MIQMRQMASTLVKVEPIPVTGCKLWEVRDQKGEIMQTVDPLTLPSRVRDVVQDAGRAYFHASLQRGEVVFGSRFIGNPEWM